MGGEETARITGSAYLNTREASVLQEALLKRQAQIWFKEGNFFRERLVAAGIYEPDQLNLSNLGSVPTSGKPDIAESGANMVNTDCRVADYCTTSGSTGDPVSIPLSLSDIQRLAINESVSFQSIGLDKNDILMLCTTVDRAFMAGLAYVEGARISEIPMVRAGIGNPAVHWDYIRRFRVTALIAVPSYLVKLLDFAAENGIDSNGSPVKKILCIGESLKDESGKFTPVAQKITERWNVQLYSTYASTEMQTAFTECEHRSGGHNIPGLIISEFLDEEGKPVGPGEAGELTITHLGVEAMPLLRFRTGDICLFDTEPCKCGRNSIRIKAVLSRKNEMLKYKGTTFFPASIIEFLSIQKNIKDFVIVARLNELNLDEIEVFVHHNNTDENWKLQVEAIIRVKPKWINSSLLEIEEIRAKRPSRKILKFIDLRSE